MLVPSMNDLMKKINNKYLLVNIVSQRARDIANEYDNNQTDTILLNNNIVKKSVQIALEDIINGKIELQNKK